MMTSKKVFSTYLFSYGYEGAECVFEIRAESAEDAKRRVSRLQFATLDGELIAKIPINPALRDVMSSLLTFLVGLVPISRNKNQKTRQ